MQQVMMELVAQRQLAPGVFEMQLAGDCSSINQAGTFVNVTVPGKYLRRPISVCNVVRAGEHDSAMDIIAGNTDILVLTYKVVGDGTRIMSQLETGTQLDVLCGLGKGYDEEAFGTRPVLMGGGAGTPPMYWLAKRLIARGLPVQVILGFNTQSELFYLDEFERLGAEVGFTTVDGSAGTKGFVTEILKDADYTHYAICGPAPMMKAVWGAAKTAGQLSLEERMGCGFGACMGCSVQLKSGMKRVCKEGPVFGSEEMPW